MPVPRASVDKVSSTPSRTGAPRPVDLGRAVTSASHSAATLTMAKVESDIDMGRKERNLIFRSVAPAMTTATPRETRLVRNRYKTADNAKPRPIKTLNQSIKSRLSGNAGLSFHTAETNNGYRIGYFVCNGASGKETMR